MGVHACFRNLQQAGVVKLFFFLVIQDAQGEWPALLGPYYIIMVLLNLNMQLHFNALLGLATFGGLCFDFLPSQTSKSLLFSS